MLTKHIQVLEKLKNINPWHFLWISVFFSEAFAMLFLSLLSYVLYGQVDSRILLVGGITASIVPLLVAPIVIYFVNDAARKNELNEQLKNEILERTKAEEKMRQVKQEWENTFHSLSDMITIHDKEYNIIRANKAAQKYLNLPPLKRGRNSKCYKYYHGSDKPTQRCLSSGCYKTKEPATFEIFEPHLNKYLDIRSIPRLDRDNNLEGIIHVARDITKRKQDEQFIIKKVKHLNTLRAIDRAIVASLDMKLTLDIFLDKAMSELDIDSVSVLLLNSNTSILECIASRGFRLTSRKYARFKLGESNAGRAAIERRIVSIPNVREADNVSSKSDDIRGEDFVSYFAVPLISKGEVKGVMELFKRNYYKPDADWLEFLNAFASQGAIAIDNSAMYEKLQRSNMELSLAYDSTIEGWSRALDMRDRAIEGHSQRVAEMTVQIAREFKVKEEDIVHIRRRGALLHDIGKLGLPDSVLLKKGKLTEKEWNIMKLHPIYARDLLYPIEHLRAAIDIPYSHHEKWDGTGYPEGMKGESIPLAARIFSVVNVYDTLCSNRPYQSAWQKDKVLEYIRAKTNMEFDPGAVEVFLSLFSSEVGAAP